MDSTIKKGRISYNLLEKELLKRDWDIYLPVLEDTKIGSPACVRTPANTMDSAVGSLAWWVLGSGRWSVAEQLV